MTRPKAPRLFAACPVRSPEVAKELDSAWERVLELLPDTVGTRREREPHITLRFLGKTPGPETVDALDRALAAMAARLEPVPLTLGYLGTFPGVLWAGIGGERRDTDRLNLLQEWVDEAALRLGFREADLAYLPHITLGRFNPELTGPLAETLRETGRPWNMGFQVDTVELLWSLPGAPGYTRAGPEHRLGRTPT